MKDNIYACFGGDRRETEKEKERERKFKHVSVDSGGIDAAFVCPSCARASCACPSFVALDFTDELKRAIQKVERYLTASCPSFFNAYAANNCTIKLSE